MEGCVVTGIGLSSAGGAVEWLRKHFRPAAAEGLEVTYQIDLTGPAGGSLWVRISAGRMQCGEGADSQPEVTLRLGATEFFGVLAGTANPDLLFMDDQIEIEGDLSLALKLRSLFSREA
jgi:predicted lipid carrier protein YhbT